MSARKAAIHGLAERMAPERERWIARNAYFYDHDRRTMQFLIPAGLKVLDLGCGNGDLLASLRPSRGVGIDFSAVAVRIARERHPHLEFRQGDIEDEANYEGLDGPFDVVVLSDAIGALDDCETTLGHLHRVIAPHTRIVIAYFAPIWEPLLEAAERFGEKMPQTEQNWLSTEDIENLLALAGFEPIIRDWRQLVPRRLLGLGPLVNSTLATLPGIRRLCLRTYLVARAAPKPAARPLSATVVIPCRNERGNIEPAVQRLPRFADDLEIIFVEGHSRDGTMDEIRRVIAAYPQYDIKGFVQDGKGKGDAVRKGFAAARGDVLIILDADLTVPPEWIPRFYEALRSGRAEFANGTRLVYPMESQAMRFLNMIGNRVFSILFTWLLNQRFTDTLCGTKVLSRAHYQQIAANRAYFGDFDPFGDFDLIFGAVKLNLKVAEVPVRYAARTYGSTQISRWSHGWLLLRMVAFAFRKLKAF
ncbi:MAG: glycosyltransferase [Alphaproteobacteria bacterium]